MKPQEIIQAAEMYNRIMEALKECEKVNKASNYNGDLLWVMCNGGTHYTNEMCDIMPGAFADEEKFYTCKNLKETAAKFTALCLKVGCSPDDIFTGY